MKPRVSCNRDLGIIDATVNQYVGLTTVARIASLDELVGHLTLRDGPDLLDRIVFKNCSSDTRAIIEFVVADRADQYLNSHSH